MSLSPQKLRFSKLAIALQERSAARERKRLRAMPRYQPTVTGLLGRPVHLVDAITFLVSLQEIFEQQLYRFEARREVPTILDCGANVGMASLYWKLLYPEARILAFEPDPAIFAALARNCLEWQLTDIELVGRAVWTAGGDMPFWAEGAHAGRLLPGGGGESEAAIQVRTVRLRDYLEGPIDLLKLDIEGAETEVVLDCADRLDGVDHLFIEYHSFADQPQRLGELLALLSRAGFRVHVQPQLVSPVPFITHLNVMGMDQALNIFAYRELATNEDRGRGTGEDECLDCHSRF